MAPPSGSIFDPAVKWDEEKEIRRIEAEKDSEEKAAAAAAKTRTKRNLLPSLSRRVMLLRRSKRISLVIWRNCPTFAHSSCCKKLHATL
jgi:hypothetical protein